MAYPFAHFNKPYTSDTICGASEYRRCNGNYIERGSYNLYERPPIIPSIQKSVQEQKMFTGPVSSLFFDANQYPPNQVPVLCRTSGRGTGSFPW